MTQAKLLIVEDDRIVAEDMKATLCSQGFDVAGIVASGDEALKTLEQTDIDLVLMDIVLKNNMDGIEVASRIKSLYDIPVVYVTAYSDRSLLERVRATEPYGYIIKPYEDRELYSVIEIALYKHRMERQLRQSHEILFTTLNSIGDAVISTDGSGCINFINRVAESLTGWSREETVGMPLLKVFKIHHAETGEAMEGLSMENVLEGLGKGLSDQVFLMARDGSEIPIDFRGFPIRGRQGTTTGVVLVFRETLIVFRDMREKRLAEEAHSKALQSFRELMEGIDAGILIFQFQRPDHLKLVEGNGEAQRLIGICLEDWWERELTDLWPSTDMVCLAESFANAAGSGKGFETRNLCYQDDHSGRVFSTRLFSLPDHRLGIHFRDMTELKLSLDNNRILLTEVKKLTGESR